MNLFNKLSLVSSAALIALSLSAPSFADEAAKTVAPEIKEAHETVKADRKKLHEDRQALREKRKELHEARKAKRKAKHEAKEAAPAVAGDAAKPVTQ